MSAPSLAQLEKDLLDRLAERFEEAPRVHPLPFSSVDPSLLSSAWQKAIRRSDIEIAQRAVVSLHQANPAYVWRRLRGIALEEVSVADLELVGQVLAIAGKQVARQKLGDLALAVHLTTRLALAPKCRTACDLLMWLGTPSPHSGRPYLQQLMSAPAPLQEAVQQARAWLGITARSGYVQGRWTQLVVGDVGRRDELLEQSGCPPLVQFIVRRGASTDALNGLLVPVYQLSLHEAEHHAVVDSLPGSSDRIGPLPSYAYCLFSGPGRTALRQLLSRDLGEQSRLMGITDPLRSVGHVVFQLEGGYCRNVLQVAHAPMIRHRYEQATLLRYGTLLPFQRELRRQVIAHLPALFEHRRQICRADKTRLAASGAPGMASPSHVGESRACYGLLHGNTCLTQRSPTPHSTNSDPSSGRGVKNMPTLHVADFDSS